MINPLPNVKEVQIVHRLLRMIGYTFVTLCEELFFCGERLSSNKDILQEVKVLCHKPIQRRFLAYTVHRDAPKMKQKQLEVFSDLRS